MIGFAKQMIRPVDVSRSQRAEPSKIGFAEQMIRPVDVSRSQRAEPWKIGFAKKAHRMRSEIEGPAPQTPRGIFEAKRAVEACA